MQPIEYVDYSCPWCGSAGQVAVEYADGVEEWVEDCQSCCSPIVFRRLYTSDHPFSLEMTVEREGG